MSGARTEAQVRKMMLRTARMLRLSWATDTMTPELRDAVLEAAQALSGALVPSVRGRRK